jgi:hypothetical protein
LKRFVYINGTHVFLFTHTTHPPARLLACLHACMHACLHQPIVPADIECYSDHRMAMCFGVLVLVLVLVLVVRS